MPGPRRLQPGAAYRRRMLVNSSHNGLPESPASHQAMRTAPTTAMRYSATSIQRWRSTMKGVESAAYASSIDPGARKGKPEEPRRGTKSQTLGIWRSYRACFLQEIRECLREPGVARGVGMHEVVLERVVGQYLPQRRAFVG